MHAPCFVMVFTNVGVDAALPLLEAIRLAISKLNLHFRGQPIAVTISGGITALLPGDSASAAFERADKALYQAKQRGRNCCVPG